MKYLNPEIQKNICSYVKTKSEALEILENLEKISSKFDSGNISGPEFYEQFTQQLNLREKEITTFLVDDILEGKLTKSDLTGISKEFSDFIKDVELLHLDLPFIPNNKFIKKLFEWFQKNFIPEDTFLLQIDYNEDLFAGLHVSYKGKYYDLSLDKKIEAFLSSYQFAS